MSSEIYTDQQWQWHGMRENTFYIQFGQVLCVEFREAKALKHGLALQHIAQQLLDV